MPYAALASSALSAAAGGPSSAQTGAMDQRLYQDGSGWTVTTGSGTATGATIVRSGEDSPLGGAVAGGLAGLDLTMIAALAIGGAIAVRVLRK